MFTLQKCIYPFTDGRWQTDFQQTDFQSYHTISIGILNDNYLVYIDTVDFLIGFHSGCYFGMTKKPFKTLTGNRTYNLFVCVKKDFAISETLSGGEPEPVQNAIIIWKIYERLLAHEGFRPATDVLNYNYKTMDIDLSIDIMWVKNARIALEIDAQIYNKWVNQWTLSNVLSSFRTHEILHGIYKNGAVSTVNIGLWIPIIPFYPSLPVIIGLKYVNSSYTQSWLNLACTCALPSILLISLDTAIMGDTVDEILPSSSGYFF
jgi:hypothetical protein